MTLIHTKDGQLVSAPQKGSLMYKSAMAEDKAYREAKAIDDARTDHWWDKPLHSGGNPISGMSSST